MDSLITPKTPIRLQDEVCTEFEKAYRAMIENHGASYAVNYVLADHLRRRGHRINEIKTPAEKISNGQTRRWGAVKAASVEEQAEADRQRELKRKRDERYREKKRAKKADKKEE